MSKPAPTLPWHTYLLLLGQALNLTAAVISVTVAALVGTQLATTAALATVPYGLQFTAVMLGTFPASMAMKRWGRRPVFILASLTLMVSGALGYAALHRSSFGLLMASHLMLGLYTAAANFYRFAAVEGLPAARKPHAMSLVVAGGVIAALLGPTLAKLLQRVPGHADFALCYGAFMALGALSLLLMWAWRPPLQANPTTDCAPAAATSPSRATPPAIRPVALVLLAAIYASACSYLIMNLLMVQSSLVMKGICGFDAASTAIQAHVLAMFAPSFLTGRLIQSLGLRQVLLAGFVLLCAAALLGTTPPGYSAMTAGLVILGLGWNLCYVGGGSLLAQRIDDTQRHRWQGLHDVLVAACATLGAFAPAPLLAFAGWHGSNLLMLPLCLAGAALSWLALTPPAAHRELQTRHPL